MEYSNDDIAYVRDMAKRVMELASSDEFEARRRRFRDVNSRRNPDRPPVWCGMAGVSRELFPPDTLRCTDPLCREVEDVYRRKLYKAWVGDDEIYDPWWSVPVVWESQTEHPFGLPTMISIGSTPAGGFKYYHPIESVTDYDRITVPVFGINKAKTEERASMMQDILGNTMPVKLECAPPIRAEQGTILEQLRGMSQMLEDFALIPDIVNRALGKITEGILNGIRAAEESGLLSQNNTGPMRCSDLLRPDSGGDVVRLCDTWVDVASQEFQLVSPEMMDEFLLSYQIPCLQQFGAVQYGCCEDLTKKIDNVLRIPNLRIFVSSYWTDLDTLIDACGKDYTIMWRQLSAHVMLPENLDAEKEHLINGMKKLKNSYYQVILREVETLAHHPHRLREWAQLAISLAEEYG